MRVKQIGNGGAFDFESVNSSFLIEEGSEYILFDCGYSVYAELRKLNDYHDEIDIKMLRNVYISHMDDDHMGSLKTLIFYMFFVHNIKLNILAFNEVADELNLYLKDMKKYIDLHKLSNGIIYNGLKLDSIKTSHHVECYGLIVSDNKNSIMISGDTKALVNFPEIVYRYENKIIFHDFSEWDNEEQQVHACKTDVNRYYPKELQENIIWYHNNKDFDKKWRTI